VKKAMIIILSILGVLVLVGAGGFFISPAAWNPGKTWQSIR
jgi:hypothetical protein